MKKSNWLNNKVQIHSMNDCFKPCQHIGFCPYGKLVEEFPLKEKSTEISCKVFGHDCPAFYMAEPMCEDQPKNFNKIDFQKKLSNMQNNFIVKNEENRLKQSH